MNETTGWTERYKRERGPGPSVTAGVPYFVTELKKVSHICLEKCHAIKNRNVTQ